MRSKPVDEKRLPKGFLDIDESKDTSEEKILSQGIGSMIDYFGFNDFKDEKISIKERLEWKFQKYKDKYFDFKLKKRNRKVWRKTVDELYPRSGYDGMLKVMCTHLQDFMDTVQKHSYIAEEERNRIIQSVKDTIVLLKRMSKPHEYYSRLERAIDARYPKYQSLISEYEDGSIGFGGHFVGQGSGWVGYESGNDPREGYFEFVDGKFELVKSPDQKETDRLLAQLHQYAAESQNAYKQAEEEINADFARLAELLKENLYSWWD